MVLANIRESCVVLKRTVPLLQQEEEEFGINKGIHEGTKEKK